MVDFINKIGQRRFAKWITVFSFVTGVLGFLIKFGLDSFATFAPYFGIFLLTAPHWFLALAADRSKEFRLFTIFTSILIVILNFLLFALSVSGFLFLMTLIETVLCFGFLVFVHIRTKNQKTLTQGQSHKTLNKNNTELIGEK